MMSDFKKFIGIQNHFWKLLHGNSASTENPERKHVNRSIRFQKGRNVKKKVKKDMSIN